MGTETPNPGVRPNEAAPGKPASRQPPDANTGRDPPCDPLETIEQDASREAPTDDADEEEDETGKVELPGEGDEGQRRDDSRQSGNP